MKNLNLLIAVFFSSFVFVLSPSAQTVSILPADIKVLEGEEWVGALTYTDYKSGKPTSIKSNVRFTMEKDRTWLAEYTYPDEPKANSRAGIVLSLDGSLFNDQKVIAKGTKGDILKIVTTKDGTDNDKPAIFRYTYNISKETFSIRKEVKLDGTDKYFERNKYSWTRKPKTNQ